MIEWVRESIIYELFLLGFCGVLNPDKEYANENRLIKLEKFIEHLKELSINAIYLGPVFESTYHGYDTIDYFKIDKRLGTNEDLIMLVGISMHLRMFKKIERILSIVAGL